MVAEVVVLFTVFDGDFCPFADDDAAVFFLKAQGFGFLPTLFALCRTDLVQVGS